MTRFLNFIIKLFSFSRKKRIVNLHIIKEDEYEAWLGI